MRKRYLGRQGKSWVWGGLVVVLFFNGREVYSMDTAALAQPKWVMRVGVGTLPRGVEVLHHYWAGETLYARIRFWETSPAGHIWYWGGETLRTIVQIPTLPPDSLMPQGDFSVPARPMEARNHESDSFWWLWSVIGGVLLGLGLFPLLKKPLSLWAMRASRVIRFYFWLWRWRKPDPARFEDFTRAVRELLRHHAPFHPGSLTLTELSLVQAPPGLADALKDLWKMDYALSFEQRSLPDSQKVAVWKVVWSHLRQSGPALWLGLEQND